MATEEVQVAPTPNRTDSGGFKTSEGTLYVSKPFRSKSTKKLRALITFAPRKSHFDTGNESSGSNEFRVSLPYFLTLVVHKIYGVCPYTGILHAILDIYVPLHRSNVYSQFRNQRICVEHGFCFEVL